MTIDKTAIIGVGAKIANDVEIGAYSIIGDNVEIGSGCKIKSHVCIAGKTTIGKNNTFYPFSVIGEEPQDLKFSGEESRVRIGDSNVFREHVTVHSGTMQGNPYLKESNVTVIGNDCLLMVSCHVAHDCVVGDKVILANNATIAGHVTIGDHVIIGGLSAVQQFVRIGDHAIVGGMSAVENDVVPYALIIGERARLAGVNIVGLKRRSFSREEISNLREAFNILFFLGDGEMKERVGKVSKDFSGSEVKLLTDFLSVESKRAICKPK